jgi:PadR family transcriptional regulator, regulatory protein PadR
MEDRPLARLKTKTTVDNLWLYILSLLTEGPMYAYEINRRLKNRFDFSVGEVTAYVVLYKLEKSGYVETEWKNAGRKRKYYRITREGEKLLSGGLMLLENQLRSLKSR